MTSLHYAALAAITFGAAFVNGALGYGFSSLTVPLALLFLSNRTLTPALVLLEVVLNAYVLWVNRSALPQVRRRVLPVTIGLAPGVIVGTIIVSTMSPDWLKFWTYVALLPLILIQTIGYRRPIRAERAAGLLFGGGVGVLYAVTTISGPPLAVALNNQGFSKQEFRAALGFVRLAESTMTAVAYLVTGLFIRDSIALLPWIVPSVAIGVPLGTLSIRHLDAETFRRVSMSFDAWIVSFGVSVLLRQLHLVDGNAAFSVMAIVIAIDAWLLRRFFRSRAG
ncbi:MAG TPA: sulfite exporter TauE/SafE family protein [Vicinamibacterales bacterium]|jgi:hypothetical protein